MRRHRIPPPPLADRLLPDALWQRIQPLLPPPPGGGAPRTVPDRACMAAILFMARTSTLWALLPVREFGCGSVTTCWNRFAEWAAAGVRPAAGAAAGRAGRRGAAGLVAGQRRLGQRAGGQGGT
jgi:transposase